MLRLVTKRVSGWVAGQKIMGTMSTPAERRLYDAIAADTQLIAEGRLQRACASFFMQAPTPAQLRGVVLMLHGWSAGPWQFVSLAQFLCGAGLHCYAARLPGHGASLLDGSEDPSLLPTSAQVDLYGEAAEAAFVRALAVAQSLGVPLFVFGFSLGGAVAVDLVRAHPRQVERLILAAPMLRPRGLKARLNFRLVRGLSRVGAQSWIDQLPFSWGPRPAPQPDAWVRPGHWSFRLGHLYAAMMYARGVQRGAKTIAVPTQLFLTDIDDKSDPAAIVRLLRRSKIEHHIWRFAAALNVPHAMLTAEENPHNASRQLIYETSAEFFLHGRGRDGVSRS